MLTTKPSVRFAVITPALLYMLGVIERVSRTLDGLPDEGLVITSGSDSQHMTGSKHYTGEALDLRSKTLGARKPVVIATLRIELGPQFTVLLEGEGTPNEHLHIQVKKGRRFGTEVDDIEDRHAAAIIKGLRARGERAHARKVMHLRRDARRARRGRVRAATGPGGHESHDGAGRLGA
jgi:hypothetical protein